MKKNRLLKDALFVVVGVMLVNSVILNAKQVTPSISPYVNPGDRVIVNKLKNNYEVGDKVVMRYNDERTSFEVTAVDGDKVTLSNSMYNEITVDKDDIIGEIIFRYYPLNSIGTIE